jgi:DNA repair protein RadC
MDALNTRLIPDAELVARVLGIGQLESQELLQLAGGLAGLSEERQLLQLTRLAAAVELVGRIMRAEMRERPAIGDEAKAAEMLRVWLRSEAREVFAALFLDSRHRVIASEKMFFGTIDGSEVHPREVVRQALAHNAAAIILAHNHPSGVAEPSAADRQITRRLQDALALIDVRVLDHFIIAGSSTFSFAARGLL